VLFLRETTDLIGNMTDIKTFTYGQNDITSPSIPSYYLENSGLYDAVMFYNNTKDFQDMYYLSIGQTPSLSFTYYDMWDSQHNFPLTGMTTTLTDSTLNTSVAGYYYNTYHAIYGNYNLTFRIVFKVGNPLPYDTIPQEHIHYNYSTDWEDQLTNYGVIEYINGVAQTEVTIQEYTYDKQGNPICISNFIFTDNNISEEYDYAELIWFGRQLISLIIYDDEIPVYKIDYKYNDQGYRIAKTISKYIGQSWQDMSIVEYILINDKVIYEQGQEYDFVEEEWLNYVIIFTYDYDGLLIGFTYQDGIHASADYFYIRNQMGDITHIVDTSNLTIVEYKYDAFGNITEYVEPGYEFILNHNSYTYRGYRFDSEINMYYLNSRYYNPEIARFINADGLLGEFGTIQTTNMYAYCANNPLMYLDPSGESFIAILGTLALAAVIGGIIGGLTAALNGDDVVAGIASGALSGAIATIGIAVALTLGPTAGILVSASAGFFGGFLGDIVNQGIDNGWDDINYNHALAVGTVSGTFALLTYGTMSYLYNTTPSVFGNITNSALPYLTRLGNSLSLSAVGYYIAVTYGALYNTFSSLLSLGINEKGEIIVDAYAGCD